MYRQKNITSRSLSQLGDVRRSNHFVLSVEDVFEGNNLDLVVKRAFLPKVSISVIELPHGNDILKFAGRASWTGGEVTIIDTLRKEELRAVLDWYKLTYDGKEGAIGLAEEYKKKGTITEYSSKGTKERSWNLDGLWITDLDLGQLDMESANMKTISFTISIDPSEDGLDFVQLD